MNRFGNYELAGEPSRTPLGWVCACRRIDDGAQTLMLKCEELEAHRLVDSIASLQSPRPAAQEPWVQRFLQRAQLQKKVSSNGSAWAPIHESDLAEPGPYYITDYFSRTCEKLSAGRVQLTAAELHGIVSSVLAGLVELRDACGRAHGNLKPSNVLLPAAGVRGHRARLTDPADGPCNDAAAFAGDLESVAKLIYQLTIHKPFRPSAWPFQKSDEWKSLGRAGKSWRDLCNNLLDPHPQARPTLDDVCKSVASFTAKQIALAPTGLSRPFKAIAGRIPIVKFAIVILAAAIVLTGAGIYIHRTERANQARLHLAASQWLDPVLNLSPEQIRQYQLSDASPLIDDADRTAVKSALDFQPDQETFGTSFTGFRTARAGVAAMQRIHSSLVSLYHERLRRLQERATMFTTLGWPRPSTKYQKLASSFPSDPSDSDLPAALKSLSGVAPTDPRTSSLEKQWTAYDTQIKTLSMSTSKDVSTAAALLRTHAYDLIDDDGHLRDAPAFDQDVRRVTQLSPLVSDWPNRYDASRLKAESTSLTLPPTNVSHIDQWLAVTAGYRRVDPAELAPIAKKLSEDLNRVVALSTGLKGPAAQGVSAARDAISIRITALNDTLEKDKSTLGQEQASIHAAIDALKSQISSSAVLTKLQDYKDIKFGSSQIDSFWTSQLLDVQPSSWKDQQPRLDRLHSVLVVIAQLPPIPTDFTGPWRDAAAQHYDDSVQIFLQSSGNSEAFSPTAAQSLRTDYTVWTRELSRVRQAFPPQQFPDLESLAAQRQYITFLRQWAEPRGSPLHDLLASTLLRLRVLVGVADEPNPVALESLLQKKLTPEEHAIAWLRLRQIAPTTSIQDTAILTRQATLRTSAHQALDYAQSHAADPDRPAWKKRLDDLNQSSRSVWLDIVNNPSSDALLRTALAPETRAAFAIVLPLNSAALNPTAVYNVALARARDSKPDEIQKVTIDLRTAIKATTQPADRSFLAPLDQKLASPSPVTELSPPAVDKWFLLPEQAANRYDAFADPKRKAAQAAWDAGDPQSALAFVSGLDDGRTSQLIAAIRKSVTDAPENLRLGNQDAARGGNGYASYSNAARGGNAEATLHLGICLLNGTGVSANPPQAVQWLQLSAAKGVIEAERQLGICQLYGIGMPPDEKQAVAHLAKSAAANDTDSMLWLGGIAVINDDFTGANQWFGRAQSRPPADPQRAIKFFEQLAANPGSARAVAHASLPEDGRAELILAKMYLRSVGVAQKIDLARTYRDRAVTKNNAAAKTLALPAPPPVKSFRGPDLGTGK
jgi:TPR repeat protein